MLTTTARSSGSLIVSLPPRVTSRVVSKPVEKIELPFTSTSRPTTERVMALSAGFPPPLRRPVTDPVENELSATVNVSLIRPTEDVQTVAGATTAVGDDTVLDADRWQSRGTG